MAEPLFIPLAVDWGASAPRTYPVSFGVPLPRGIAKAQTIWRVLAGNPVPTQVHTLATWPDGSSRWILVHCLLSGLYRGSLELARHEEVAANPVSPPSGTAADVGNWTFPSGERDASLARWRQGEFTVTLSPVQTSPAAGGRTFSSPTGQWQRLHAGPVCSSFLRTGPVVGLKNVVFAASATVYPAAELLRLDLAIENQCRARHRGGTWDLGDAGSCLFADLSLALYFSAAPAAPYWCVREPGRVIESPSARLAPEDRHSDDPSRGQPLLEIYQDSSGGEHWQSLAHVNRRDQVTTRFRGYAGLCAGKPFGGLRATPTLACATSFGWVSTTIAQFWQNFPKAMQLFAPDANGLASVRLGLFPERAMDLFELQGGERKTHTLWLRLGTEEFSQADSLEWVHRPTLIRADAEWVTNSGAVPYLEPGRLAPTSRLEEYLEDALSGPDNLFQKRERIDEFGWRHFGDVPGDHEELHATGPRPTVSHYNNQYDMLLGMLLAWLRSGDRRWWGLAEPLARHVCDIDLYHTARDRSAYNHGLFWHTDHYRHARTATHRTYSRHNAPASGPYGGGPSNENNYTSGLLLWHYLTGDTAAAQAVIDLADWVIAMDEGRDDLLYLFDSGPTGLASRTREDSFHGPGRGAGNSINALMDAWSHTGSDHFRTKAEELIRRTIHPNDDIAARELLDAERRWSYIVHLHSLAKFLWVVETQGHASATQHYARAALIAYADWMVEHETPFLDRKAELEFPTETWPALDIRKAGVLWLARRHVDPADVRRAHRFAEKARQLADRGWSDLLAFSSKHVTRAIAVILVDGWKECVLSRDESDEPHPGPISQQPRAEFGVPANFQPRKERVRASLRRPGGWVKFALAVGNPANWAQMVRAIRARS